MRAPLGTLKSRKANTANRDSGQYKTTDKQSGTGTKIKAKRTKKKNEKKQEQNLNAAARDLGTLPSDQTMFYGPQLRLICGSRPVLLYLWTSHLLVGPSTLRTVSPF
jgi:hypothetical protein